MNFVGVRGDCGFLIALKLQYSQNFKFCGVQHFVRSISSPVSSKFCSVVISLRTLRSAFAHCRLSGVQHFKPDETPPCMTAFPAPWSPGVPLP